MEYNSKKMKLGYCHRVGNRIVRVGELLPFGTHIVSCIPKLYPDEISAYLNLLDFDFDIANKLDAIIFMIGAADLEYIIGLIDKVSCKKIIHVDGGECDLSRWNWREVYSLHEILKSSDLVLYFDKRTSSFWNSFVNCQVRCS